MLNKITSLLAVLSYAVVVSQSFMYILALKNTQLALGGSSYTEVRQLIDANMRGTLKYVLYAALLANLSLVLAHVKAPFSPAFITAAIAFLALIADVVLTLKGSLPLNEIINGWSPANFPANWREVRQQWFSIFQYRQILTIVGFVSLLAGVLLFDKK